MAVVEARMGVGQGIGQGHSTAGRQHIRRRITSGSARWAVASQSLIMLAFVGLFVFFFVQDVEAPYSSALVALLGVFAVTRIIAVWNLSFSFSDAGLEIYTSVQHHWLGWRDVTAISDVEIRRQNALSMLLSGSRPFRVLRIHRKLRPPITVRATRGIDTEELEVLHALALRNGVEWMLADDFETHARERGVWSL